jgi:hypothetical protein
MKKRTYILIAVVVIIAGFLYFHSRHTAPATDIASLTPVLKPTTSEPILRVVKLDNASTMLMVITGTPSQEHRYTMAWSGSRWQISQTFVKP